MQRTLAIELQRLSVQFRKQQKAYLSRLRQKDAPSASGASFSVLDETSGTSGREAIDPDYDPGFNEIQVCSHDLLSQAGCCRTQADVERPLQFTITCLRQCCCGNACWAAMNTALALPDAVLS